MITDEERRAVTRRLRRSRSEWSGMGWRLWLGPKFCAVVLSDGNRDELEDAAHRLADLIDPDCEEGRYSVARTVRPVDRDALLELADEMDAYSGHFSTGLQECTVQAWAVAIREALGVEHG